MYVTTTAKIIAIIITTASMTIFDEFVLPLLVTVVSLRVTSVIVEGSVDSSVMVVKVSVIVSVIVSVVVSVFVSVIASVIVVSNVVVSIVV